MDVQVRTNDGGLNFFKSVFDAFEYAKTDLEVWKISWNDPRNHMRIRFVRTGSDSWRFDPILTTNDID